MGQYDAGMWMQGGPNILAGDAVEQAVETLTSPGGLDGSATWAWWPMLIGAGLICLLLASGFASPRALDVSPPRAVKLGGMDLLIALFLIFAGLVASLAIVSMIAISPMDWINFDPATGQPIYRNQSILMGTLIFQQLCSKCPVLVYLLYRLRSGSRGVHRFGLGLTHPGRDLLLGVVGFVIAFTLIFAVNNLVVMIFDQFGRELPQSGHEMINLLVQRESLSALALLLVSAVLLAPVLEEVIYRGMVQTALLNMLGRERRWLVIQLAAIIFALIHAPMVPWYLLPSLYLLGVVLGWIYERYASLWPCILIHMAFNGANVLMAMMMQADGLS